MITKVMMPKLSEAMETGKVIKWLKKEGDPIKGGDVIAEIETDKANVEIEAFGSGVLRKILVGEGGQVPVGETIGVIADPADDIAAIAAGAPATQPPSAPAAVPATAPAAAAAPPPLPAMESYRSVPETANVVPMAPVPSAAPAGGGGRIKVSPLARKVAAQSGVDLRLLQGTGPGGRIVRADVDGAAGRAPAPAPAAAPAAAPQPAPALSTHLVMPGPFEQEIPHEEVKLSNIRKTIARRLSEAKQQVPHIYLTVDIQLDELLKLRGELNAGLESRGIKLSVNDLLIKALARSLMEVPECNVAFAGDHMFKYGRADISVAVSIPAGLITPIIASADAKSVSAISAEMKELAGLARDGKLQPQQYQGGTASLSNMGMFGIKQFEAVINPPQGMIMAIGAGEKRPYVINDSLQIASVMSATGSFDHRAIDGADGAKLMKTFKDLVENPLGMLA